MLHLDKNTCHTEVMNRNLPSKRVVKKYWLQGLVGVFLFLVVPVSMTAVMQSQDVGSQAAFVEVAIACGGQAPEELGGNRCDKDGAQVGTWYRVTSVSQCNAAVCQWYCPNGTEWRDGKCKSVQQLCSGVFPTGGVACPGVAGQIGNWSQVSGVGNCSAVACQWYCPVGTTFAGGSCQKVSYSCGTKPRNSTYHPGDDSNLTSNLYSRFASSNTSRKCEFFCNSGYSWNSNQGQCNQITQYTCTGTIPSNARAFDNEELQNLTRNLSWVYRSSDTSRKCQFHCDLGRTWNGSKCVL